MIDMITLKIYSGLEVCTFDNLVFDICILSRMAHNSMYLVMFYFMATQKVILAFSIQGVQCLLVSLPKVCFLLGFSSLEPPQHVCVRM